MIEKIRWVKPTPIDWLILVLMIGFILIDYLIFVSIFPIVKCYEFCDNPICYNVEWGSDAEKECKKFRIENKEKCKKCHIEYRGGVSSKSVWSWRGE